jgi:hypothetical protein
MPSGPSETTTIARAVDPVGSVLWYRGARFFASGSGFLLLGGLAWAGRNVDQVSLGFFWPITAFALVSHLAGWITIGRAAIGERSVPSVRSDSSKALLGAYAVSLIGLAVGLLTLPLAFPNVGWFGPSWVWIFMFGFFPYEPSVFAPVVIVHAALFLLRSRSLGNRLAFALVSAGCVELCLAAGLGLASQLSRGGFLGSSGVLLAGSTCLGYGCIALAWRSELGRRLVNSPTGPPAAGGR